MGVVAGARGVRVDEVQAGVVASVAEVFPRSAVESVRLREVVTGEVGRPCLGRSTSEHYPPVGSAAPSSVVLERERDRAQKLCRGCPVLVECRALELAARDPQAPWGIWGGICEWDLKVAARAIREAGVASESGDSGSGARGVLRDAS